MLDGWTGVENTAVRTTPYRRREREEEARKGMLTWNFADMEKTLLFGTVPVFLSNKIRGIK